MAIELRDSQVFGVADPSRVGEVRRAAAVVASRLGFDETRAGRLAIVVTEAANNVVRHALGGEVILRPLDRDGVLGVEVLAVDKGPGIRSVARAMEDGYSTGGTPGTGLGAIRRLSSEYDLFSAPGAGTVLVARLWAAEVVPPSPMGIEVGAVCLPVAGEDACGDTWSVVVDGGGNGGAVRLTIVVADGLGHGSSAAEASRRAVELAREHAGYDPVRLMETLHAGLRSTRGAAVALVAVTAGRTAAGFVGVGNIATSVLADASAKSLMSHNGTVGAQARRIQLIAHDWPADGLLVMHSDGLASQWQLSKYPGLASRHPSVIAGVLYRDHRRLRDDVTVLVARRGAAGGAT